MPAKVNPVRITRPAGRRSGTEKRITDYLVNVGETIQTWMIDNNRIATGKSINSLNVVITRQPKPGKQLASVRKEARQVASSLGESGADLSASSSASSFDRGGQLLRASGKAQDFSDNLKAVQRQLNKADLGIVSGQLKAAPSLQFALEGRGPGKMPPVNVIKEWMQAKKVVPIARSINQSAYLIARKIGAEGTSPPHFEQRMLTQLIGASFQSLVRAIATPIARIIGRKFVRALLGLTKDFDNMTLSHETISLFNEALDEQYGSNVTGTNPPK